MVSGGIREHHQITGTRTLGEPHLVICDQVALQTQMPGEIYTYPTGFADRFQCGIGIARRPITACSRQRWG